MLCKSKPRGLLEFWESQDQKCNIPTFVSFPTCHNCPPPWSPAALVSPVLLDGQMLEGDLHLPAARASAPPSGEALRSCLHVCLPSLKPCCSFLHAPLQCLLLGTGDDAGGPRWRCNHTVNTTLLPAASLLPVNQSRYPRPLSLYYCPLFSHFLGCQVYSLC